MKKVLFLQIKGKSKAGVWFVNKTIGERLIKDGMEVSILAIRDNPGDIKLEHDKRLKLHTINTEDLWEISRKRDIKSFKSLIKYIKEHRKLNKDYEKARLYIREMKPDYIVSSHYQCLDFIPREYYKKTINIQHSAMKDVLNVRANFKTLKKYSGKIFGFVWLSIATMEEANRLGFKNNYYLYNPVRFVTEKRANVTKNKKLICITRIENYQKRINLMISIVDKVLKKNKDWTFELYGSGTIDDKSLEIINNNKQIKYMGLTNDPESELLKSSINLNTSSFEGFSLSILEASMCGIPTVSFNFGESVYEEIFDGKTGYIIEDDNIQEYIDKLDSLMNDNALLDVMSKNNKEFAKNFDIDSVISNWYKIFNEIDKNL